VKRARRATIGVGLCVALALPGCGGGSEPEPAAAQAGETIRAETVTLVPRFEVGERSVYEHVELSLRTQESAMLDVRREATERRVFALETVAVSEGGVATLKLEMLEVAATLADNGEMKFDFDTARGDEADSPPARARALIAGLTARVVVSPSGAVLSMESDLEPDAVAALPAGLRSLAGGAWFLQTVERVFRPEGEPSPVALGEPWTTVTDAGPPFEQEPAQYSRTLEASREDGVVRLDSETVLRVAGEFRPERYTARTRLDWDLERGRTTLHARRQRLDTERMVAGAPAEEALDRQITLRLLPDRSRGKP